MNIKQLILAIRKRLFLITGRRYIVKGVHGCYFLLDMRNYIDRQVEAFGEYEADQFSTFKNLLQEKGCDIFVDIGAHWGYYSILIKNEPDFVNTKIYAFEPDPINRNQLFGNIFLNRLQGRIQIYSVGLSDKEGLVTFDSYGDENRGRSKISAEGACKINVRTFDSLKSISNQNIGLKIDVEGHELSVICGMRKTLKHNNCILQIESFSNNSGLLIDLMDSLGYMLINQIGNDYYYSNVDIGR